MTDEDNNSPTGLLLKKAAAGNTENSGSGLAETLGAAGMDEVESPSEDLPTAAAEPARPAKSVVSATAADLVEQVQSASPLDIDDDTVVYMSKHRGLTVHIRVPLDEDSDFDSHGKMRMTSVPIVFKDGIFKTRRQFVIKGLEEAQKTKGASQLFRRADNMQAAAIMREAHVRSSTTTANITGGPAVAGNNDAANLAAIARLNEMKNAAYQGG